MKNLPLILQTGVYRVSLVMIGSVPGLFIPFENPVFGSINRLIGGFVFLLWLLSLAATGRLRKLQLFHLTAIAFALWYLISLWWSVAPDDSPFLAGVIQGAALTVMLWDIYRTHPQVEAALQAFLLGGYVSISTTVFNYLAGNQARHWEKRFAGSGFDPNDLALLLAIGIPLAAYLAAQRERAPWLRFLNGVYPLGAGLVIVLTGSRGAMLAAAPAYLFYLVMLMRLEGRWRWGALAVLAGALACATQLDLNEPLQRLASTANSASGDHLSGRADIWRAGWTVYGEHPFLGMGGGAYETATAPLSGLGQRLIAHNTYLSVLTELGPVGFLLFLTLMTLVVRSVPQEPRLLRGAFLLALLVWGIGVSALSWEFRSQTWLLFALTVAAGHCAPAATGEDSRRRLQASPPGAWPSALRVDSPR